MAPGATERRPSGSAEVAVDDESKWWFASMAVVEALALPPGRGGGAVEAAVAVVEAVPLESL